MAELSINGKTSGSSRWWEYYFLRYFFGTVIGAGLVLVLTDTVDPAKKSALVLLSNLRDAGAKDLTALAAAGLAYCYVASAPMLTLHILRMHVLRTTNKQVNGSAVVSADFSRLLWVPFVALVLMMIGGVGYLVARRLPLWSILLLAVAVVIQMALLLRAHCDNFIELRRFYWLLAAARRSQGAQEYVESYRHMREHSNAYAIIVLEFMLAACLFSAGSPLLLAVIILVWLLPPAYCWLMGSVLEAECSHFSPSKE